MGLTIVVVEVMTHMAVAIVMTRGRAVVARRITIVGWMIPAVVVPMFAPMLAVVTTMMTAMAIVPIVRTTDTTPRSAIVAAVVVTIVPLVPRPAMARVLDRALVALRASPGR
jgi:hypothetical protein